MSFRVMVLITGLLFAGTATAQPQNYFWDPSIVTGNWTTDLFWSTPTAGNYTAPWNNTGHVANFSGTNQTITVSSSVFLANVGGNGLNITGDGLLIDGSGVLDVRGVNVSAGNSATISATVAPGTGVFTKNGLGTLTLSGSNTYSGGVNVFAGTLKAGSTSAFGDSGNVLRVESGAVVDLNGFDTTIGAIDSNGSGTITNSSATTATLTINANAFGTGFAGILAGNLALTKTGSITLILNAANSYTGGTTINGGTVRVATTATLGSTTGALTLGGSGTLSLEGGNSLTVGALSGSGTITAFGTASLTANNGGGSSLFSGVIEDGSGTMSFTKAGAGTLTLTGTSTYTGATTFNGGTVAIESLQNSGVNSNLGAGSSLVFDGGALQYANTTTNANSTRSVTLNAGGGTLDVANAARTVTLSGVASGTGGLTKTGAGTLSLTNNTNSYTGATVVNGGVLTISGGNFNGGANSPIGFSPVVADASKLVLNGGTLRAGGNVNFNNRLFTLGAAGGTLDGGDSTVLNFNGTGAIAYADPGTARTLTLTGDNTSATSILTPVIGDAGAGVVSVTKTGAGEWTLQGANTYTGATTISGGTLSISSGSNLGNGSQLIFDGGTLASALTFSANKDIVVNAGGGTLHADGSSYSISGQLSGSGGLTKAGIGSVRLLGTSTYTGVLTVADGVIGIGAATYSIGGLAGSGDVQNTSFIGVATLTVGGGGQDTTFSGELRDSSASRVLALTKTGNGTLTLSGTASTYTGATTINGGVLSVASLANGGANSSIGASSSDAGNLVLNGGTLRHVGGLVGTDRLFTLTENGGTLDASGSGTLQLNNSGPIAFTGSGARTLTLTGTSSAVFSAAIGNGSGGATGLTKTGTGLWVLFGANTFAGPVAVQQGALHLASTGSGGANAAYTVSAGATLVIGNVSLMTVTLGSLAGDGVVTAGQSLVSNPHVLNVGGNGLSTTFSGVLRDSTEINSPGRLALTKVGTGTLALSGTNTYTGGTNINDGRLDLNSSGALGTTGTISFNGGTLRFTANNTTDYSARFSAAAGQQFRIDTNSQFVTLASNLTSAGGSLNKINSGTLNLTGANDFTGGVTITNGRLVLGNSNALGSSGPITFAGGTMVFTASNNLDYSSRFTDTGTSPYSFDTGGQTVTLASELTGADKGLIKGGTGTLILSGANNTYGQATQILNGTLRVTGQIVNSAVTITGSSSTVAGTGRAGSSLTLTTGGAVAPGLSVGTLTVGPDAGVSASALTFAGGGIYNWEISGATGAAGTGYDTFSVNGGLTVTATSGSKFTINVLSIGAVADFNPNIAHQWTLVQSTNASVTGFDPAKFNIVTSGFVPNTMGGMFGLMVSGGDLQMTFTPVPEPGAVLAVAFAGLGLFRCVRARRKS